MLYMKAKTPGKDFNRKLNTIAHKTLIMDYMMLSVEEKQNTANEEKEALKVGVELKKT